jgi:hypothetical protein
MFSFRHDKVGFFFGLALLIVCGGTFIATLVLLIVGICLGDYQTFLWPIRWVLFGWWLGCIVLVLSRVYIRNWQMKQLRRMPPGSPGQTAVIPPAPLSPEALVASAQAEAERYQAFRAIGVSAILGVVVALTIVSILAASIPNLPGSTTVQIVAWSVGGGVIVVVVLLCVIGLRLGDTRLPYWPQPPSPPSPPDVSAETASSGVQQHSTPS